MSETLEEAVTTNAGDPPAQPTPDSSEPKESEQQVDSADAKPDTKSGETEAGDDESKAETPWEGFELEAPEHSDAESIAAYAKAMREHGLSPEAAQQALNEIAPVLQQRQMATLEAVHKQWIEESRADPDIGGDRFDENMALAKRVLEEFGDDESQLLFKSVSDGGQGLGNHPALNRLFVKLGKAFASDTKVVTGRPAAAEESKAKRLFSQSKMND